MVKMEIRMGANVFSKDGPCGQSVCVVLDPIQERVSHLVIQENQFPYRQRLVPIQLVRNTSPGTIVLESTTEQLKKLDRFVERQDVHSDPQMAWVMFSPYFEPTMAVALEHLKIPAGKIAVLQGTHVRATDGAIGQVDEVMIDRIDGRITDLILRAGHFWKQKDVAIPVAQIKRIRREGIELRLCRKDVNELPEIHLQPVPR